jgi:F0F1-type ATP synthase delta subunit
MKSELRRLNIIDTEVRLELPRDEVIDAIRMYGGLRLRKNKNNDTIELEHFNENKSYGYCENNKSPITIISTQNYSDPGIGHFSYTVAKNLNANYISNEHFSSGASLKRKQINFSTNEYYTDHTIDSPQELVDFYNDVTSLMSASKIVINFGTASAERTNHIHILFGGEKSQEGFNIANRTFDCLDCIKEFYSDLSAQLNTIGELKVATHDELGNSNNDHLSLAIRKEFNTNIITLNISLNIIHSDSDKVYFQTMKAVIDAIENNFLEDAKHHND